MFPRPGTDIPVQKVSCVTRAGDLARSLSLSLGPCLRRSRTSITATAVRIVQHGWLPAVLLYIENGKRKWFIADPDLSKQLWPHNAF
jgi:hypothetical protein